MEPEPNLGPLAPRDLLPLGLKECHVSKDQQKTSPATERKSGLGQEREKPGAAEGALFLSLPVPQREPLGPMSWGYPQREGRHASALLPAHQGEAGD